MNAEKAEFWLCLSRAFLPPMTADTQAALRDCLADDLQELAATLGYPLAEAITDLRSAVAALPDPAAALVLYSRLFLVPGTGHPHINTGVYFDGTVNGDTVRKLAECYGACGLEKDASLADLPDHAAVQLEFAAWLFASAAAHEQDASSPSAPINADDFIAAFIARWAPLLRQDLAEAGGRFGLADNPWLHLARIVETASAVEAAAEQLPVATPEASEIERLRRLHAGRMPDASELAELRASLERDGLSTAHLAVAPADRDAAAGLTPLTPPRPPRHSLPTG